MLAMALAVPAYPAELPVRQVVLYKHGVGYFERAGAVAAGDSARLDFKADQMNDVLKSLSIQQRGGGTVSGVRYDSSIPLEDKLADFPFKIENGQALSAILDQLRGARVELQFGTDKTTGIVVGARSVAAGAQPGVPVREQITLLLDSGDLKTLDLAAASGIRFVDNKLQAQFRDYLAAVAASRSAEKRSVFIDMAGGAAAREIVASYLVPSPVWKSSYRLLLADAGAATLEGWAIVDNTTGEDWTGVKMALISGKPISFLSELYEPKYIDRLTADLPEEQAVKPVVHAGSGFGGGVGGFMKNGNLPSAAPPAPVEFNRLEQYATLQKAPRVQFEQAKAEERGELFEYDISGPVTVRKNESAMLPFLQDKVTARKLLIFSEDTPLHPLQAAELKNVTGKTLDGGPITVTDAGRYAGEALVATVKAGEKRLISYAIDLGTSVTTAFESTRNLTREVHLSRGVLTSKLAGSETKTFTATNVDAKAKTLILEHPKRAGYQLLSPKPSELTAAGYRFELALLANGSAKLAVVEERVFDETFLLSSLSSPQITLYLQNKNLSEAGRRALNGIMAQKAKIADLDRQISATTARVDSLNTDAKRVRENLATLNGVSGQQTQVQTYAARLASIETELGTTADLKNRLQTQRSDAQTSLDTSITALEF